MHFMGKENKHFRQPNIIITTCVDGISNEILSSWVITAVWVKGSVGKAQIICFAPLLRSGNQGLKSCSKLLVSSRVRVLFCFVYCILLFPTTRIVITLLLFLKILFILFLEQGNGREKERERNINLWLPLTGPHWGEPGLQPRPVPWLLPQRESNSQPSGLQAGIQSTEPHQPGQTVITLFLYSVREQKQRVPKGCFSS